MTAVQVKGENALCYLTEEQVNRFEELLQQCPEAKEKFDRGDALRDVLSDIRRHQLTPSERALIEQVQWRIPDYLLG